MATAANASAANRSRATRVERSGEGAAGAIAFGPAVAPVWRGGRGFSGVHWVWTVMLLMAVGGHGVPPKLLPGWS